MFYNTIKMNLGLENKSIQISLYEKKVSTKKQQQIQGMSMKDSLITCRLQEKMFLFLKK